MRFLIFLGLLLVQTGATAQQLVERNFQKYFDEYGVRGSFLLFDQQANRFTAYNVARCNEGFLPGATFQIPAVLIGLETGALPDTTHLLHYDGTPPADPAWAKDETVGWAVRHGCDACFQQLSRDIGVKRYQQKLVGMKFGIMVVMPETLDSFWQSGISRISQFQQVAFLRRLHGNQLSFTARNQELTRHLFRLKSAPGWTLYGKAGKTRRGKLSNGWFVGWLEQAGNAYFFALNVEPKDGKDANELFIKGRREITEKLLHELNLMP